MKASLVKSFSKFERASTKMVARLSDLSDKSMEKMRLLSYDWDEEDLAVAWSDEKLDFEANEEINRKISLWRGDITVLEIDSIVNAANMAMRGGGGIDGRIHQMAGPSLLEECIELNGCKTGRTKATRGHNLPCQFILHTVGPRVSDDAHPLPHAKLTGCYSTCLDWVKKLGLRSVAFCCISTGIFGYPIDAATHVALKTVRLWLEDPENRASVDRIVFCVYNPPDLDTYEEMLQLYFPPVDRDTQVKIASTKKANPIDSALSEATNIKSSAALIDLIKRARQIEDGSPEADFGGLERLIGSLDKPTSKKFFSTILPKIIDLALQRKKLFSGADLPLLIQAIDTDLELTSVQVACLMACAFLTIQPTQSVHAQTFAAFNCAGLWKSWEPAPVADVEEQSSAPVEVDGSEKKKKKKKKASMVLSDQEQANLVAMETNAVARFGALLAYFEQDFSEDRTVTYSRQTVLPARDPVDWRKANYKLAALHVINAPLQTAPAPQVAMLPTFSAVAKTLFEHAPIMSRTDAFLWTVPESLVVGLLASTLLPDEVIHIKNVSASKHVGLDEEGRYTFAADSTVNPTQLSHLLLVPQLTVSLPRHESSRFYIYDQLTRVIGALRTLPNGKKVAVQHWGHGLLARDHSATLNFLVLLATTSFETLSMGETFKDKKRLAERQAGCPELFLYSHDAGDTLGLQLQSFMNVIETQHVQYDIILASLLGNKILNVELPETGTVLEQLTHRFANWKKEYKKYQKEQMKLKRAADKEAAKKAAARRKEMEARRKAALKEAKSKRADDAKNPAKPADKAQKDPKDSNGSKSTSKPNGAAPSTASDKPKPKPQEEEEETGTESHTKSQEHESPETSSHHSSTSEEPEEDESTE